MAVVRPRWDDTWAQWEGGPGSGQGLGQCGLSPMCEDGPAVEEAFAGQKHVFGKPSLCSWLGNLTPSVNHFFLQPWCFLYFILESCEPLVRILLPAGLAAGSRPSVPSVRQTEGQTGSLRGSDSPPERRPCPDLPGSKHLAWGRGEMS